MNREEILKRAQNSREGEMVVYAKDKSMTWTYLALVASSAFFAFLRESKGQPMMDLCATLSISVFVGQFYRFLKTKEKRYCVLALISLVVAVISIVRYFGGH